MKRYDTSMGGQNRFFPTTLWTLVLDAGKIDDPSGSASLGKLVDLYWKPAYLYIKAIRRKGVDDAKDLTQSFFTRLLEKGALGKIERDRGSFRGFLKTSIRNFLIDTGRFESARRPPSGRRLLQIEEFRDQDEGIEDGRDPDEVFEREWKQSVLFSALAELERSMKEKSMGETFEVFRRYCLPDFTSDNPVKEKQPTYEDIAEKLGLSRASVRKRLSICRDKLREILRDTIRNYVSGDEEARDEYRMILGEEMSSPE